MMKDRTPKSDFILTLSTAKKNSKAHGWISVIPSTREFPAAIQAAGNLSDVHVIFNPYFCALIRPLTSRHSTFDYIVLILLLQIKKHSP
jgi:hypothetical protein